MKKTTIIAALCLAFFGTASAQIAPQSSPSAKIEQRVGLTDISVKYSRPSKHDRVIFGDLVPFGEIWRTGANENTVITFSDDVAFGKDSLKAGTYALYTKPTKTSWEIIFYNEYANWGNPEQWSDSKVALRVTAKPALLTKSVETFTISIDDLEKTNGGKLTLAWDKTQIVIPFTVPTDTKVMKNINKLMAGPSANEYFAAAQYYQANKKDPKQALEWINKAVELSPDAFWILRMKALIQADLGDKTAAIETAKAAKVLAEKADNKDYVKMLDDSIKEWSKKK